MNQRLIASRKFTQADQDCFANLSGDYNPIHIDAVAARRSFFGQQVIHGLHLVIWSLESILAHWKAHQKAAPSFQNIAARFLKPVFLGEAVHVSLHEESPAKVVLRVILHETVFAEITISGFQAAVPPSQGGLASGSFDKRSRDLAIGNMANLAGTIELKYERQAMRHAFPITTDSIGPARFARLLSLTRLVGMECPGSHSLFSAFDVAFGSGLESTSLPYLVTRVEPQFSRVHIAITGGGLRGKIDAFVRPAPRPSVSITEIARHVEVGEFRGRRPLVVGASRGLGALIARLLAHGGADVLLTYHLGSAEAQQVAHGIRQGGGQCNVMHLDVADPESALSTCPGVDWRPTDVYYFATPKIATRKLGFFDNSLFQRFADCYQKDFCRTILACRRLASGILRVFYPSTVYVADNPGDFGEYAAAKAAGEVLCQSMQRRLPDTRVLIERLPPLPTDQTASLIEMPVGDGLSIMSQIARKMLHLN